MALTMPLDIALTMPLAMALDMALTMPLAMALAMARKMTMALAMARIRVGSATFPRVSSKCLRECRENHGSPKMMQRVELMRSFQPEHSASFAVLIVIGLLDAVR